MRINKAATAYGLVTCCVSITSAVFAHFLTDGSWFVAMLATSALGSLAATASIEMMAEIKE